MAQTIVKVTCTGTAAVAHVQKADKNDDVHTSRLSVWLPLLPYNFSSVLWTSGCLCWSWCRFHFLGASVAPSNCKETSKAAMFNELSIG
jgi:hypothetical protein